jgi:hypothetical protein
MEGMAGMAKRLTQAKAGGRSMAEIAPRLAPVVLLLAAALLYFATLDNGLRPGELMGGDLITHQYAQVQARPSNAPGYPLYTMGGWAWFHLWRLAFGTSANPISVLASYSTLWALLALWLLYRLILEATDRGDGGNWPSALLASGCYAVTFFFWYYGVNTEEYTSAVAWTLAVVLLALRWQRTRRDGYLLGIAFLAGVGLAHILTVLLIIPPLLWFVLTEDPRLLRRPRLILAALVLAALPLASYAFVYIRGAQHPEWRGVGQWASTWAWFWSFLSTRQGISELTWSWRPFFTLEFPALIWRELTPVGLLAGLGGLWLLRDGRGKRRLAAALYATLVLYLAFCWIDRMGNWYQVIMPVYALLALGLGLLADAGWRLAADHAETGMFWRVGMVVALLALLAYTFAGSYGRANSHNRPDDTALAPAWAMLADAPPHGAAVLGTLPEEAALNYLTIIWGVRPDLRAVTSQQARGILAVGAPPLVVTQAALPLVPAEVSPAAHYSALGRTLITLSAAPLTALPATDSASAGGASAAWRPWTHDFGDGVRLAGGYISTDTATGETVVRLVWLANARPAADWSVSVRLSHSGQQLAQFDRAHPVAGAYPTTRWSPGERVADAYSLRLPPGAAADALTVILYRRDGKGGFINLGVANFPVP